MPLAALSLSLSFSKEGGRGEKLVEIRNRDQGRTVPRFLQRTGKRSEEGLENDWATRWVLAWVCVFFSSYNGFRPANAVYKYASGLARHRRASDQNLIIDRFGGSRCFDCSSCR